MRRGRRQLEFGEDRNEDELSRRGEDYCKKLPPKWERNETVPWGADEGACGCRSLQGKHPRIGSWENSHRVKMSETWRRADCNWRLPETSFAGKSETWRGDVKKRRIFIHVNVIYELNCTLSLYKLYWKSL